MRSGLFADAHRDTPQPKATPPLSDAWTQGPSPRDTPVASAMHTPSMAPRSSAYTAPTPSFDDTQETLETKAPTPLDHFRNRSRSARERLEAYKELITNAETDEKVLYLVEGINADVMEIQLVALQEITARQDDSLLDEVFTLFDSDDPNVALCATISLANIGDLFVVHTLLIHIYSDSET